MYIYGFVCVCVCVSVGRASVGPAVKQSNSRAGGLHPPTNERLSHCAARGQPIHTGTVHSLRSLSLYFISKTTDCFGSCDLELWSS